jgi:uncharacterized RDD family membrane protein YckC
LSDPDYSEETNADHEARRGYELPREGVVGSRIVAALIDAIPLILLFLGMAKQLGTLRVSTGMSFRLVGWPLAVFAIIVFGYFTVTEAMWGTSPGKRMMGLEVRSAAGDRIGWRQSLIRNLVRFVDWIPAFYPVGILSVAISGRDQRLGDRAAKTVVVHRLNAGATVGVPVGDAEKSHRDRGSWVVAAVVGLVGIGLLAFAGPPSVTGAAAEMFVRQAVDAAFQSGSYPELETRSWDVLVESTDYETAFNDHIRENGLMVGEPVVVGIEVGDVELVPGVVYDAAEYWLAATFTNGSGALLVTIAVDDGEFVIIGWQARLDREV